MTITNPTAPATFPQMLAIARIHGITVKQAYDKYAKKGKDGKPVQAEYELADGTTKTGVKLALTKGEASELISNAKKGEKAAKVAKPEPVFANHVLAKQATGEVVKTSWGMMLITADGRAFRIAK